MGAWMNPDNLDEAPVAAAGLGSIPVIDLSSGLDAATVAAIADACRRWGFFQVIGHGLDSAAMDAVMTQTAAFFARPKADKRSLMRSRDNPWGFYDRELTKTVRDKKEVFDIGPDIATDKTSSLDGLFAGQTRWPSQKGFQATVRRHFSACETLSETLVEALSLGLGASPDRLATAFRPAHTSFLRLNFYPVADPLAGEDAAGGHLGIHHHTDAGALTVLMQDRVAGLQVFHDGLWYGVEPLAGAFVINIGDMVQVWSNDAYRAPIHRVLAMENRDRFSIPFFYNPAYEAVVEPLPEAVADRPARYTGFSWGEFRRKRADGDFSDYGTEVQISDYRL